MNYVYLRKNRNFVNEKTFNKYKIVNRRKYLRAKKEICKDIRKKGRF